MWTQVSQVPPNLFVNGFALVYQSVPVGRHYWRNISRRRTATDRRQSGRIHERYPLRQNSSLPPPNQTNSDTVLHPTDQQAWRLDGCVYFFSIHFGIHFYMKVKYNNAWYTYDGMQRPKLMASDKPQSTTTTTTRGKINCIFTY